MTTYEQPRNQRTNQRRAQIHVTYAGDDCDNVRPDMVGVMKIHTETMCGNVHEAATTINKRGWADYLVSLEYTSGNYSTAIFKMPNEMVYKIREESKSYASDPHHDDSQLETLRRTSEAS